MPVSMREKPGYAVDPIWKPERLQLAIKHTTPIVHRSSPATWPFLVGVAVGTVVTGLLAVLVLP